MSTETNTTPDVIKTKARAGGAKGHARRTRMIGDTPGIIYGPSYPAKPVAVDTKTFIEARRAHGPTHMYTVEVEGEPPFKALIKEVQQNPVSRQLEHIDLYHVDMSRPIRANVRLDLVGKAKGSAEGGILQQILRNITVRALPAKIPEKLELDVSELDMNDSLHVRDIKIPGDIKVLNGPGETVCLVTEPEEEIVVTPTVTAVEGAVPAEGAAAAPGAAPGAPGAAPGAAGAAPAAGAKGAAPAKDAGKKK